MERWYLLIEDAPRSAAENMAVDQYLLELVDAGLLDRPILRSYSWEKPTVSLGYHQQLARAIDTKALEKYDIALVRRWTGGRAVLHDFDEITYAVVAPTKAPFLAKVKHNYNLISEALERFTDLGSQQGTAHDQEESVQEIRRMKHAPCFASLSQAEIETSGKKLIGSAQKLGKSGFLQHGSIPLIHRADVLEEVTGSKLDMNQFMISLSDHYRSAGLPMPARELLNQRLKSSFESAFNIEFEDFRSSGLDHPDKVSAIASERYELDSWTFRK